MTCNIVKVARAPITACLQCPLCSNLVHEATTICECLHTFCRDCIYQRLEDGESECCPICNVNLGCSPLEKLRADHQLDDVRAKIFPIKMKRPNDNVDGDVPVKRKERSLSSLGITAARSSSPVGLASRKTKPVSKRSAVRDTSTENETDKSEEEDSLECKLVVDSDEGSQEVQVPVKKEILSDEERDLKERDASLATKRDQFGLKSKRGPTQLPIENSKPAKIESDPLSKLGMYFSERKKGPTRSQAAEVLEQGEKPMERISKGDGCHMDFDFKAPTLKGVKGLEKESPLAHLAEVAIDQAGQIDSLELPKARGPRARRSRAKLDGSKSSGKGEGLSWQAMLDNIRGTSSTQQEKKAHTNSSSQTKPFTSSTKLGSRTSCLGGRKSRNIPSSSKYEKKKNAGFWFALQADDNQWGENALPQISSRYLRLKDGKLPVSFVKKYLMKKFDLQSETEVEITCRGQPVVPNLPLESLRGIWFSSRPSLDFTRESGDNKKWAQLKGQPAEDYMMVLTYGRHKRPITGT